MSEESPRVTSKIEDETKSDSTPQPNGLYRAKFTWNPPPEDPELSPDPLDCIPLENVQRKKFQHESNRLQEKSREDLSQMRKNERQRKMDEKRDESL